LVLEKHCFDHKDLDSIYRDVKTLKKKYKNRVFLKPPLSKRDFLKWYSDDKNIKRCHFIRHSIFISSCGDIIPCQFLRESKLGKAAQDSVEYIWHSKRYNDFRSLIRRSDLAVCKRCCK
jgi:MoaA/NifB/PqqE/SkfB family radical SAM enzyme